MVIACSILEESVVIHNIKIKSSRPILKLHLITDLNSASVASLSNHDINKLISNRWDFLQLYEMNKLFYNYESR